MTSGLFEISCGRRMICFRYRSMFLLNRSCPSGETENAVADAALSYPESSMSSMPSWTTSV